MSLLTYSIRCATKAGCIGQIGDKFIYSDGTSDNGVVNKYEKSPTEITGYQCWDGRNFIRRVS